MESPAAQNSKKRVFVGGSSWYNDPDVVEIPQPTSWNSGSKSKSLKRNKVTHREVIYIDSDDDSDNIVVINDEVHISNNGKQPANMLYNNMAKLKTVDHDASLQSQYCASGIGSSHFRGKKLISSCSSSLQTRIDISPEREFGANRDGNPAHTSTATQLFKQFDTVEDHSDHHYLKKGSSVTQQPKKWAKRIQEEWKILENDLPDTIFVRVYESRMDLMRAAIVGAQGTPYHDGLFFFDVFFPSAYPSVPPLVYYHSGGLRINPNLYNCGKVCLSLLNTWPGSGNEKWVPNVSTMLQVLVSIQALILNEKPYFNEPGYASLAGSAAGKKKSTEYSENMFLLSLRTMVYTMRKPPLHFKLIVIWHFNERAQNILGACKAYIEEGKPVGSITTDVVQSENAKSGRKKKCPLNSKANMASHVSMLVEAFMKIGVKDCEKFLPVAEKDKWFPF